MSPKEFTLEYIETGEGWHFKITSFSGVQTSEPHKTKRECKKSAKDVCREIRKYYQLNRKK